jgi:hypothetical protein
LRRTSKAVGHSFDTLRQTLHNQFHDGRRQFVFGREVIIHRPGPDVGKLLDFQHRGSVDALSGHNFAAGLDQRLPVAPFASRFGFPGCRIHRAVSPSARVAGRLRLGGAVVLPYRFRSVTVVHRAQVRCAQTHSAYRLRPVRVIFDVLEPGMVLPVNPNDRKYRARSGVSAAANRTEMLGRRMLILPLLLGLIAHRAKNVHD